MMTTIYPKNACKNEAEWKHEICKHQMPVERLIQSINLAAATLQEDSPNVAMLLLSSVQKYRVEQNYLNHQK